MDANRRQMIMQRQDVIKHALLVTGSGIALLRKAIRPSGIIEPYFSLRIYVVPADSLAKITDIYFAYDERAILNGITRGIPRGKLIAIMGNSGCGKTTLLRLIGGQLKPCLLYTSRCV